MAGASGCRKSKHYPDVKGIKVTDGQIVNAGALLTREGDKWRPGKNVGGLNNLYALCKGRVSFSKKRGHYRKMQTYISIIPAAEKKEVKEP